MNHFIEHLSQPEYLHVLLNPIPVYGLALGIVALIAALFFRTRAALVPALLVILLSAGMAWPVFELGEKSYDRVYSMVNTEGDAWLNTHMHRAEKLIYVFYALAVLAAMAIFAPVKWPKQCCRWRWRRFCWGSVCSPAGCGLRIPRAKCGTRNFAARPSRHRNRPAAKKNTNS